MIVNRPKLATALKMFFVYSYILCIISLAGGMIFEMFIFMMTPVDYISLVTRTVTVTCINKMVLIFVYGTLKTGQPNYYLIEKETRGICKPYNPTKVYTIEKYPLIVESRYNIPFMLYEPGKGHNIEGELYEVDETRLEILDQLENHPRFYERCDVTLTTDVNDVTAASQIQAQAYFLVKYRPRLLDLPMLKSYADLIDGKNYFMPKNRDDGASHNWWYEVHTGYEK